MAYREWGDSATATNYMLINWECTTMPPRREEALKWLPPESDYCSEPFSLYAEKWHSLCDLATTFPVEGFSLRVFQARLLLPGCLESFCQQVDSKIVLWMWSEAMLVYVPALCLSGPFFFSKDPHPHPHSIPFCPWHTQIHPHTLRYGSVDAMLHSRLVYTHCPSL